MAGSRRTTIALDFETLQQLHQVQLRLCAKIMKGEVELPGGFHRAPSMDTVIRWLIGELDWERERKKKYKRKPKAADQLGDEDSQAQPETSESA